MPVGHFEQTTLRLALHKWRDSKKTNQSSYHHSLKTIAGQTQHQTVRYKQGTEACPFCQNDQREWLTNQ